MERPDLIRKSSKSVRRSYMPILFRNIHVGHFLKSYSTDRSDIAIFERAKYMGAYFVFAAWLVSAGALLYLKESGS